MEKYVKCLSGFELIGAVTTKIVNVDYENIKYLDGRNILPPVTINYDYLPPDVQAGDSQFVMNGIEKRFNSLVNYLEKNQDLRHDIENVDPEIRDLFGNRDITGTTLLALTGQDLLVILYSRKTRTFKLFLDSSIMEGVEGIKPLINRYTEALFKFKGALVGDVSGKNHVITNLPVFISNTIHKDLEESLKQDK